MISAREFFEKFKMLVKEETIVTKEMLPDYPEIWGERNIKQLYCGYEKWEVYTKLINKYVVETIIKEAGLTPQYEYFKIDVIGWDVRDKDMEEMRTEAESLKLLPYLWDMKIAVEHENDDKKWVDEVIKLIHINCPLKVVIGYNNSSTRNDNENDKLEFIAKWMQKVNMFDKCKGEEFLLIFGNSGTPKTLETVYFDFRGYLFDWDSKEFVRI